MARIHLIAIGGAVMHQLAIFLHKQGNVVTGSDDVIFDPALSQLKGYDLLPANFGWNADCIDTSIDTIILGMHAKPDNVELKKAQDLGLTIYSFPEFIFQRSQNKKRIVIAGSHGKTSITSMIMHILKAKAIDFDYLVGARIEGFDTMVRVTDDADCIVIEGDEYLSSAIDRRSKFLHYHPDVAVISGIAWDHINVFPEFEGYLATFISFIESISADGKLIYFDEDEHLPNMVANAKCALEPYSAFAFEEKNEMTTIMQGEDQYTMQIFGRHNMENMRAAALVCLELGIPMDESLKALSKFKGSANRLERIFSHDQLDVFRDFAHAPSKLKATVQALRSKYAQRELVAIFELHTYSSLQTNFLEHYDKSLNGADHKVIFLDAHALKIKGRPNIDDQLIIDAFGDPSIQIIRSADDLRLYLEKRSKSNAVYAFMSSGNFNDFDILTYFNEL